MSDCTAATCAAQIHAKGHCWKHYRRLLRTGSLGRLARPEYSSDREKLEAGFIKGPAENGCWEWQGGKSGDHGTMCRKDRTRDRTHRICHQIHKGEIPEGMVIDHLCGDKLCCNPDHLKAVTNSENLRRGGNSYPLTRRTLFALFPVVASTTWSRSAVSSKNEI